MLSSKWRGHLDGMVAVVAAALCLLTIVWPDWIEGLFGWDPDHHSGWVEWVIVAGLLVMALICGTRARRDLRVKLASERRG